MKLYFVIRCDTDEVIAWSTDKKLIKTFIYYRNIEDVCKIKKKSISKTKYENIQNEISNLEILLLRFPTNVLSGEVEMISFPITKKELVGYYDIQIVLSHIIGKYVCNNPFIFKKKFVEILFKLLYAQKYFTHNAYAPMFDFIKVFSKYLQVNIKK